jgi:hypothetical protein
MNLQLHNMTGFAGVVGTIALDAWVEVLIIVQIYTGISCPPTAWIASRVPS